MRTKGNKLTGMVIVALLALFIGLVLAIQIRTTAGNDQGGLVPVAKLRSYETELKNLRADREEALALLADAQERLSAIEKEKAAEDDFISGLVDDIDKNRMAAGLTDVHGPGVIITIKDPAQADEYYGDFSVIAYNSDLLLSLVNKLREAGAEAISINEIRIVATSEISLASTNININGTPTASPYTVKAIGNPATLANALTIRGGIIETMRKSFNLTVDVEQSEDIPIGKYTGVISFKYASPVETGEQVAE